jgi:hypothetical protein
LTLIQTSIAAASSLEILIIPSRLSRLRKKELGYDEFTIDPEQWQCLLQKQERMPKKAIIFILWPLPRVHVSATEAAVWR